MTDPAVEGDARNRTPDELRVDNAELREELGATVDELTRRMDVPTRAREWRDDALTRAQITGREAWTKIQAHPAGSWAARNPLAVAGGVAAALLVLWLRKRRARRRG
jgi:Protein of unknown function (DUF3618)